MEAFAKRADNTSPEPAGKSRRWPCLVVVVVLFSLCLGTCGGVFVFISRARKSSPAYRMALQQVQADRQVIEQLGQPIEDTTMLPVVNEDSGRASLDFDVAGPRGKAHVRAEARKIAEQWGLTSVVVSFGGGENLSLEIESGEGPSDAPAWPPSGQGAGAVQDSAAESPPMNIEAERPPGVDVQLPNIPKLPE